MSVVTWLLLLLDQIIIWSIWEKDVKGFWTFNLPVKNADYNKLQKNKRFKVEIIDVWAMTVTEYPVIFETTEELDYRVFDIHHRGVRIPDAPYIVLRITEVK